MENTNAFLEPIILTKEDVESMFVTFDNLIISKNLKKIRDVMEMLTTEIRNDLIYNCPRKKNMMFQACFANATEIVEYFITRCMADINEVTKIKDETLTPLFVAIKTANNDLINLLLKHGANMNWRDPEGRSAIVYACDINKMEAAYTLKNHGANINDNTNQNLCVKSLSYFKRALKLGADVNYVDEKGETTLMKAVSNSNIDIINLLLKEKADIYLRSYESGRNALDLAHFLEKDDVLTYFKENSVYSLADKVISYDLDFARAIIIDEDMNKSVEYWKTSRKLRKKHHNTLSKHNPALEMDSDIGSENIFESITLAKHLNIALQVVCRIIEINHPFVDEVILKVAHSSHFLNNLLSIDDLKSFSKLNLRNPMSSCVYIGLVGTSYLCEIKCCSPGETDTLVLFIEKIVDLIIESFVPILKNMPPKLSIFHVYKHMMFLVLRLIDYVIDIPSRLSERLVRTILKITPMYIKHYPTSILLIAIERGFRFEMISSLIAGGADANAMDYHQNTPLQLLEEQPANLPNKMKIFQILIKAGGRIDATNAYGISIANP